jgi:hypothetical protein
LSLLTKWRWRLLTKGDSQWSSVLVARYGDVHILSLDLGRPTKTSLSWKDIEGIGRVRGLSGDWAQEVFVKKVGNGGSTKFWHHAWCGSTTLCKAYPRLFQISLQPQATIKDLGGWENGSWRWYLQC